MWHIFYKNLGKYDEAVNFLVSGREILNQITKGSKAFFNWHSLGLFHLILISHTLSDLETAQTYLQELEEISNQSRRKINIIRYRFATALVKAMSKRAIDKFEAQQIFQAIVDENVIDHSITTLAMLNLCELLILELKITETEEEIFNEVINLSDKLQSIASVQSSSVVQTMSLILKSKLALVAGDLHGANDYLKQAHDIVVDKNLNFLLPQINNEQNVLHDELEKWKDLIHRNASVKERFEHARVESYILEAKKVQEAWLQPSTDIS